MGCEAASSRLKGSLLTLDDEDANCFAALGATHILTQRQILENPNSYKYKQLYLVPQNYLGTI
jgi:hypothetical protein